MLNEQLRLIRKFNGYTQQQIADILEIDRSTYASYEIGRNRPDIAVLQNFAKIFKVTVDYILNLTEDSVYRLRDDTNDFNRDIHRNLLLSELSADEKMLIGTYRQLDDEAKKQIVKEVKGKQPKKY